MDDKMTMKYWQEKWKCADCFYCDQKAIKKSMACCQYGFKLSFSENQETCLTRKEIKKTEGSWNQKKRK